MVIQISKKDAIIFPYILYRHNLRPMANIKFQYATNKIISFSVLIDSGADTSCSFVSLGKKLGVDFTQYDREPCVATGLKGECLRGYRAPISLWIGSYKKAFTIYVSWLDIPFDPDAHFPFLLGREKIFDEFDIVFQEHKKRTIFRKI